MRLIINGYDIELKKGFRIKQTKQVNDIGDVDTRQTNFTNSISVPKTPNNVRAFNFLSLVGNRSRIPYQRNETYLYGDNGELLVWKGWAVPKETTTDYKIYVYDGLIDFYKAIENKTLTDLDISELNHLKNLATVVGTWDDLDLPYRYNVADYNGKMLYDVGKLNIDYLIPSASIPYLFDKVFEFIGWTYEGNFTELDDFLDSWLSYPKTIGDDTQQTIDVHVWQFDGAPGYFSNNFFGQTQSSNILTHFPVANNQYIESSEQVDNNPPDGEIITVLQDGLYKFTLSGQLAMEPGNDYDGTFDILLQTTEDDEIIYNKVAEGFDQNEEINEVFYINLKQGQYFILYPVRSGQVFKIIGTNRVIGDMQIDFDLVTGNEVDFEEALIGLSIRDFITEVMVRFSLTAFPDKINKHIRFLQHIEIVNSENPEDWSDKFQRVLSEKYIYGRYGQKSRFKYKYDDLEASHNDGFLYVGNVNLPSDKTVHSSKFYSPEKSKVSLIGERVNVYKFWNKEVDDDGAIKYKELDGRFYIMKSKVRTKNVTVGSERFQEDQQQGNIPFESFTNLHWQAIVNSYYPTLYSILNDSKLMKIVLNLDSIDISNLDLSTPKYFKQLGAYFQLNKVRNWEQGRHTTCEMIRLEKSETATNVLFPEPQKSIRVTAEPKAPDGINRNNWAIRSDIDFLNYVPQDGVTIKAIQLTASPVDGGVPTGVEIDDFVDEVSTIHFFELPEELTANDCGWWKTEVTDPNENLVGCCGVAYIPCEDPNGQPNIYVTVESDQNNNNANDPMFRDVTYIFENFEPTTATLKAQEFNPNTGVPQGEQTVIQLNDLTEGITHQLNDVEFKNGIGFYKIELLTDVINYDINGFLS